MRWFWPLVILLSGIATELVVHLLPGQQITMLVTMWFLFVCPGMAFLRFFRLGTLIVEITIAVALSLSIDAVVTGIFLYAHAWNPTYTLLTLIICSGLGAIGQLVFMREPSLQVSHNDLNIVGEDKVEEFATVSVPATNIAALMHNENRRTTKATGVTMQPDELSGLTGAQTVAHISAPHAGAIEAIPTRMMPKPAPQTLGRVEELPTNMLPSVPASPKFNDGRPTNMVPIAPNSTSKKVENMPTSMLPSMPSTPALPPVPTTPRMNEDLPTHMLPIPPTERLVPRGPKSNPKNGTKDNGTPPQQQERGSSSHPNHKKHRLSSVKKILSSDVNTPVEDRPTTISTRER